MSFNPRHFESPQDSPGPLTKIHVAWASFRMAVTIGDLELKINAKGVPKFLSHRSYYGSCFSPPPELREAFWLAVAILEAQEQFQKADYPDIFRERMEDLAHRDRAVLQALKSWDKLSQPETEALIATMVVELAKATLRWIDLRGDLVQWAISPSWESGEAGRVKALLTPGQDVELAREQLDEAYGEYKQIYRRIYNEAPALSASPAGHL